MKASNPTPDSELRNNLEEAEYEIKVLKGKLDEKQAVDVGMTATFTLDATKLETPEDFVKAISLWGFHRGNWQNFIAPDELQEWTKALTQIFHQHQASAVEEAEERGYKRGWNAYNEAPYNPNATLQSKGDKCEYGCKGAGKHYHDPNPKQERIT